MGDVHTHATVHDVERTLVVLDGVNQVVTIELRVIVAGITSAKGIALTGNGVLAKNGRGVRGTRRANPVLVEVPVALLARELAE